MKEIIDNLEKIGIVPVIKLEDISKSIELAEALRAGGINCAEITFRAKDADIVINTISKKFPDMLIGAGTVLTVEQADAAIKAGAKFLVAPGFHERVVAHSLKMGVPFIPGVASASEVENAIEAGLSAVKFFPAEAAGGIEYIKAMSAPYSGMRYMPTGGVNEKNLNGYLAFDKVFACGGSWMVAAELIENNQWKEITRLCRSAIDKMLGFELVHVGINADGEESALKIADAFNGAFGFGVKNGNSSVFAGTYIEVMKGKPPVDCAFHIAIATNSVKRAVYALSSRGFGIEEKTAKTDAKGKMTSVYLKGAFSTAVHLLQK